MYCHSFPCRFYKTIHRPRYVHVVLTHPVKTREHQRFSVVYNGCPQLLRQAMNVSKNVEWWKEYKKGVELTSLNSSFEGSGLPNSRNNSQAHTYRCGRYNHCSLLFLNCPDSRIKEQKLTLLFYMSCIFGFLFYAIGRTFLKFHCGQS